ncbi:MAG: Gfo/Idh/MocA family oxidoreductase [Stigonema ocellatum SAG 48.90 = DSM 106950]|nr:Gfo/Idh/MocA family oxidoreductase [Stigonema ocellatum SAG 48.90 = DSM 106950]
MFDLFAKKFSRRKLLTTTGLGLVTASAISKGDPLGGVFETDSVSAQEPMKGGELPPQIKFSPDEASTETNSGGSPTALPPEKRLGFAIVGLGRLALEEIMPAFGMCKLAKPTALVSGNAAKANQIAQQYGINPKNIYNYQNYDTIRNNPDVDIIYIIAILFEI